jgi:hypothetical protein
MAGTYAEQFVREGFVALAFDYAHYGESAGNTAYLAARDPRVKGKYEATGEETTIPAYSEPSRTRSTTPRWRVRSTTI